MQLPDSPALINATHNVVNSNATFKTCYNAKIDEGRTNYNTLGQCANKLARIMFKMLPDNVTFNLE